MLRRLRRVLRDVLNSTTNDLDDTLTSSWRFTLWLPFVVISNPVDDHHDYFLS